MPAVAQLPPRTPSRRLGSAMVQRRTPVGYRRSVSSTEDKSIGSPVAFRPKVARSQSFGVDSSHLDGDGFHYEHCNHFQQQRQQQQQLSSQQQHYYQQQRQWYESEEEKEERRSQVHHTESAKNDHGSDQDRANSVIGASEFEKERDQTYSAETIALRRFMTMVAWGPGLNVVKHNRGRGRVRRVLKFDDEEGYLYWCGTFPPFHKTRVSTRTLLKASRVGSLVTVMIADQGDVAFECSRLTDAIVLDVGLNGVIRVCNSDGSTTSASSPAGRR